MELGRDSETTKIMELHEFVTEIPWLCAQISPPS